MDDDIHRDVTAFLVEEAKLLDDGELREWLEAVPADDVTYEVPTRTTQEKNTRSEFSDRSFHLNEDRESLALRIERLENEYAWGTNPPPRTRRFVSNVRVHDEGDEFAVADYLLFVKHVRDSITPDILSAQREHRLRTVDDGFELVERRVLLDDTAVGVDWLPIL